MSELQTRLGGPVEPVAVIYGDGVRWIRVVRADGSTREYAEYDLRHPDGAVGIDKIIGALPEDK